MSSEISEDKLTIKNILFTKVMPNYVIPVPTEGYKIFPCTDCGDRFLLESSYEYHINRKSLKITYMCRHCRKVVTFYNRCRLLSHIRSHAFKTATIFVSDIKIEPLPIEEMNCSVIKTVDANEKNSSKKIDIVCNECDEILVPKGTVCNTRAQHYMNFKDELYTCPICLFTMPNSCTLSAHLRIHLRTPPYFCPECGVKLSNQHIIYPYHHNCEGFNMIRATTRLQCNYANCNKIFHPSDYRDHIKNHFKRVNGEGVVTEPCLNEPADKNSDGKNSNTYYKCPFCPNEIIKKNALSFHLNKHFKSIMEQNCTSHQAYLCKTCNTYFNNIYFFLRHQISAHGVYVDILRKILLESSKGNVRENNKGIYRVIKRCDKCLTSFSYRCTLENINILPNECPYKCTRNSIDSKQNDASGAKDIITCSLCKNKISGDWKKVKEHFASFHKNHKCLDLNLKLPKIQRKGHFNRAIPKFKSCTGITRKNLKNNNLNDNKVKVFSIESKNVEDGVICKKVCKMCSFSSEDKKTFENHIIIHRDPCMAYQCPECGKSFMVKLSFSTHLLLEHDISDIDKEQCYNEFALSKQSNNRIIEIVDEPVEENQCNICRDQFGNPNDLEKHYRVHGMAFLKKNRNNSP